MQCFFPPDLGGEGWETGKVSRHAERGAQFFVEYTAGAEWPEPVLTAAPRKVWRPARRGAAAVVSPKRGGAAALAGAVEQQFDPNNLDALDAVYLVAASNGRGADEAAAAASAGPRGAPWQPAAGRVSSRPPVKAARGSSKPPAKAALSLGGARHHVRLAQTPTKPDFGPVQASHGLQLQSL